MELDLSREPTTQEQIIRQSTLKCAVDVSISQNKTYPSDILELAEKFEKWVHRKI